MVLLMRNNLQLSAGDSCQAASHTHACEKSGHIGVFQRTRKTADANRCQLVILACEHLFDETRQVARMLKDHLRLLQAAASGLHAENLACFAQK